jgi:geranylgeranyl diphosphate synthase type I
MHDQSVFAMRVDAALEEFLDGELEELTGISHELEPLADQARVAVSSGKRLRAAFCYWGWRAAGQPDCEGIVRAAAAMELVHAAAIVHDDIIDGSALRRGLPSAHRALRAYAADGAGTGLALLLGNLLIAWSGQLFTACGLPAAFLSRARPLWTALARDLIAGEALEILRTGRPVAVEQAMQVVRLKTARYTVEQPLLLGGLLGGASADLLEVFTAYGVPLGEAFQLRDDLLGVFGDPRLTGKCDRDDLTGGKPTVLLSLARRHADAEQLARLDALVGRVDLTGEQADRIRTLMHETEAPARVERLARGLVERALGELDRGGLDRATATALRALAAEAYQRVR